MDNDVLRWILTMLEATEKPARLGLRLSEVELYMVPHAVIKQPATDVLIRLKNKWKDLMQLDDEVEVLTVFPDSLTCVPLTTNRTGKFLKNQKAPLYPLSLKSALWRVSWTAKVRSTDAVRLFKGAVHRLGLLRHVCVSQKSKHPF